MFIAVTRLPDDPAAFAEAAALCGLAQAEARSRCAGPLPRVLVRQAAEDEARAWAAGLEALGFRTLVADPRLIPTDAQRIVARQLAWADTGFTVTDLQARSHEVFFPDITLFQTGLRTTSHAEVVKSTERKFSMGRALATGGLSLSKTVETTSTEVTSHRDSFVLVERDGGRPGVILYESRLNFQCLGAALQHTRAGNLKVLLERLRTLAGVAVEERAAQPAFLRGLPHVGVDEVDLGLFLAREGGRL